MTTAGAASWDKEYAGGRYHHEPLVAFVADILTAARRAGMAEGLYIGCGNGRNYEPLVRGGLDLTGLDISGVALRRLFRDRIRAGDVPARPSHPETAARDRSVDPVGGHMARERATRRATLRVNISCAAPADLATMSSSEGR